jgi:hypothetical protein
LSRGHGELFESLCAASGCGSDNGGLHDDGPAQGRDECERYECEFQLPNTESCVGTFVGKFADVEPAVGIVIGAGDDRRIVDHCCDADALPCPSNAVRRSER